MTTPLSEYIKQHRTTTNEWNVTGIGPSWGGKYKIPDEEYDAVFLPLVHAHVFKYKMATSLLEKHGTYSPILIDLDFRYQAGGPLHRRFTQDQVQMFVAAYAEAFAHFFEPPPEPLQFFVQLKPSPEADPAHDAHKDGIHIVVPNITLSPEIQFAIRGYILQSGAIERIFGPTGMTNEPTDCFDISVIQRNNWFLYGACKPNKAWYKVEYVWAVASASASAKETTLSLESVALDTWTPLELVKMLSIRVGHESATPLTLRTDDAEDAEWAQLLGRWGKGSNWAKTKSPGLFAKSSSGSSGTSMADFILDGGGAAGGGAGADTDSSSNMIQISGLSVRSDYSPADCVLAYRLTRECLNPERRCGEYQDWVSVALCLKNISDTTDSFNVWADLTRRTGPTHKKSQMSDTELQAKWNLLPCETSARRTGRKPLLMGTLHLWAKEDNEATYRSIMNEANREVALLNDNGSHVAVADLILRMYRHEFRCTPTKKSATAASMDWYQYAGNSWRCLKTSMRIRERLSNEVRNQYIEADREVGRRITSATNDDDRQRMEVKRKNLFKVEQQLMNCGFKDSVMKELSEKFYDEDYLQHMNQDVTLVGFSNGVLELRKPSEDGQFHTHFRPGRPDDCISFQMGRCNPGLDAIPYIPYNPAAPAPEHLELLDFFTKIYPDAVLREYALTLNSACLEGSNHEQKFYIMSGSGGNGKSKIIDLNTKTFGDYAESLPVTALTRKRADAGSANPELIVLKCRRYISMVEPEEGEKINTSLMKQISGQDTLKARGLFQDQDQFVVTARIFMSCNDLPAVSSMDNGTWRRLVVLPHVATFVEEGKPTNPAQNIHSRDPLLDNKIMRWRPFYAGLLVWYYENRYLRGGLKEPAVVTAASNKYKEENDSFLAFCQECLVREVGAEATANDVLIRYKEWSKYNTQKKVMQKKDLMTKMQEIYGKPVDAAGKVFGGVRVAYEGDDVSGNFMG
uniref:SF3 helicase domain-containing protein n=1 Tax=viral metagenome TaxID=1070528 RepID=A0A6C0DA67_9ZZZZ